MTKKFENHRDPNREHTFKINEGQAEMIFKQIEAHCHALKNHIATAVQSGEFDRAQELVTELRQHEALFACFNMEGKRSVAVFQRRDVLTEHEPRHARGQ